MDEQIVLGDNDKRMYQHGMSVAHSSDDGGCPDVGSSIGLGGGAMLYLGEVPKKPGWSLCIYRTDGPTIHIADGIDGGLACDALEGLEFISAAINVNTDQEGGSDD